MRLTAQQDAAVRRREGDVLLAASAGSGKTRVLAERFARAVVDDGVSPRSILAITFTEKAAGELGERIRDRLRALGREDAAREAESGWIDTFHGWAARILRTHPLAAGIDPRFRILDEVEAARLERDAFDVALAEVARERPAELDDLLATYSAPRLRPAIVAVHAELRSRGEPIALPAARARFGVEETAERLRAAATALSAELAPTAPERAPQALERAGEVLAAPLDPPPTPLALDGLCLPKANGNGLKTEACEGYRSALQDFTAACVDIRALALLDPLDALLRAHAAAYARAKRERGALDFADLELSTRDLLRNHPGVRAELAERFTLVMVDEFQDTNPLQMELLELVCRNNLFTVGDEFQAIYGFRHADVGLFRARRRALAPRDRVLGLTANFRSRPEILSVVNRVFGERFAPDFAGLVAGREDVGPAGEPVVELLVTGSDGWAGEELVAPGAPPPAQAWRRAEARMLAQRVSDLVSAGRPPGEIVVLLRATGDLGTYARALEDRGVPTYVVGGRGFWAQREVQDLVAWLSVLANPREELRLFEVLASPLVGASADALVALGATERDPWTELTEPSDDSPLALLEPEERARLADFAKWAAAERAEAPRRRLEELLERALIHADLDLALLRTSGGPRRLANVRKLMRLARDWEAAEGPSLRAFLDLVADRTGEDAAEAREGEAPIDGEDLDAVRLMTIHRAKGLEFGVVCVADLGRQRAGSDDELIRLGPDGEVGLRAGLPGGGKTRPALAYAGLGERARAREDAEETRLFHVAMTRAEEKLILSGAIDVGKWPGPSPKACPLSWLGPAVVDDIRARAAAGEARGTFAEVAWCVNTPATVGEVLRAESLAPAASGSAQPPSPSAPASASPPAPARVAPRLPEHLSYSSLEEYRRCAYRFHAERVLRLPRREETAAVGGTRPTGLAATDRGTLVHALLEHDGLAIDAAAERLGLVIGDEDREDAGRLVAAAGRSPVAPRLAAAPRVAREEGFAFVLDGLLVTGYLDALVRDGTGALVVDYKTNRLDGRDPAEVVAASYPVQELVYALALLRDGAEKVEVCFLFLERPDEPVTSRHTPGDVPALEDALRKLTAGLARGDFPVAPDPNAELCAGCPVRGTLCSHPYAATLREPASALAAS